MFRGCSGLTSVTLPDGVTSVGDSVFKGCIRLTNITLPDGMVSIGDRAFQDSGLTSITLPDSMSSIGDETFGGCSGLTSITFNGTKAEWKNMKKGYSWNAQTGNYTVHCSDGDIAKEDA